ncbi:hypothetical protein [Nostoc sp. 106C]|uniref:hypothetical protein n=1 Tax=Nostoc sp. 106C TaxID=1932667 RepID=UPI000A3CBE16|nr:hypothetical protein [Nostoc sp. 106C]OUL34087.1 hypothetical protein BV375_05255 [Nostoc sp. 106C]
MKQLNWRNPDDWGKSPLTDRALQQNQARDEALEQAGEQITNIIKSDLPQSEKESAVWNILNGGKNE